MWIETDRGWINADHVHRVTGTYKDNPPYTLWDREGNRLGQATEFPGETIKTLVAAGPGVTGFVLESAWNMETGTDDVAVTERPIVAWSIDSGAVRDGVPIFAGTGPRPEDMVLIKMPDGTFEEYYSRSYATLDEAKAVFLQRLKREKSE